MNIRKKKRICLLCDRPNWAHDHSAKEIVARLSDEFEFEIKYVVDKDILLSFRYDAILVFFWGEESYKRFFFSKKKVIKQVSSHRWQFDPYYGPMSVEQFANRFLSDANTVICPSKILYNLLEPHCESLFLCGKGYSDKLFSYIQKRDGEMSLCLVGNIDDPVKGINDIFLPSTKGRKSEYAKNLPHNELIDLYNRNDIYVVASVHEADPLPLIESMACGCFPVATRIGIAPELIEHKKNGYIVEERTVEAFKEAFCWCEANLEYIRESAEQRALDIKEIRNWDVRAEDYRKMLREHLGIKNDK